MDIWIVISYPANYTILFFLWGLIPAMIQPVFHGCQAFFGGFGCPSNGPLQGDVKAFMNAQMPLGGGKKASPLRPRKLKGYDQWVKRIPYPINN